jgi:hypothetical protein
MKCTKVNTSYGWKKVNKIWDLQLSCEPKLK